MSASPLDGGDLTPPSSFLLLICHPFDGRKRTLADLFVIIHSLTRTHCTDSWRACSHKAGLAATTLTSHVQGWVAMSIRGLVMAGSHRHGPKPRGGRSRGSHPQGEYTVSQRLIDIPVAASQ